VKTAAGNTEPQIEISSGGPRDITVKGSVPAGENAFIRKWQVEDPSSFARTLFIEALKREGVAVTASPLGKNPAGRLPARNAYVSMKAVALLKSPPYSEQAKLILKVSHNLGADITPLLVAAKNGKFTFEEGMTLEQAFLKKAGVDVTTISFCDGEGGDKNDLVTPRATVQLLRYMAGTSNIAAYRNALPILGVDGTLSHSVPPKSPARGKVQAKTGTIIGGDLLNQRPLLLVKGLAGYMTTASGRILVFAFFVNNVPIKELNDMVKVGNDLGSLAETIYLNQ
jgi:D-alanyl-D-alanine carboxypeptidase/D-alanyl-D-alanine-endopeptidase (penicillin-binding protein 4)